MAGTQVKAQHAGANLLSSAHVNDVMNTMGVSGGAPALLSCFCLKLVAQCPTYRSPCATHAHTYKLCTKAAPWDGLLLGSSAMHRASLRTTA